MTGPELTSTVKSVTELQAMQKQLTRVQLIELIRQRTMMEAPRISQAIGTRIHHELGCLTEGIIEAEDSQEGTPWDLYQAWEKSLTKLHAKLSGDDIPPDQETGKGTNDWPVQKQKEEVQDVYMDPHLIQDVRTAVGAKSTLADLEDISKRLADWRHSCSENSYPLPGAVTPAGSSQSVKLRHQVTDSLWRLRTEEEPLDKRKAVKDFLGAYQGLKGTFRGARQQREGQ